MYRYTLARQLFSFQQPIRELEGYQETSWTAAAAPNGLPSLPGDLPARPVARTVGWVAGAQRAVQVHDTQNGYLLKVEGCGSYWVSLQGEITSRHDPQQEWNDLDRQAILGPALVLALALRGVWSLHASAALFEEKLVAFLAESGQGKSTLAGYLARSPGWRLAADDILPASLLANAPWALPRFPQLKLPAYAQPGMDLPDQIPLSAICLLEVPAPDQQPELHRLNHAQAAHALLRHTAGTRLFDSKLLRNHLEFSALAAGKIQAYRLVYPHRLEVLPQVRDLLENLP